MTRRADGRRQNRSGGATFQPTGLTGGPEGKANKTADIKALERACGIIPGLNMRKPTNVEVIGVKLAELDESQRCLSGF